MADVTKGAKVMGLRKLVSAFLLLMMASGLLLAARIDQAKASTGWQVRSVDTQVISKCWVNVPQSSIDQQIAMIKSLGVNYVAIGTPYDRPAEMQKWVTAIHNAGLHVWFRSHWLRWEGDEGQPKDMSASTYLGATRLFITLHPDFFQAGDSFTVNVEAENAGVGPGTPFADWNAYRAFLVQEIQVANEAFSSIGLGDSVYTNWLSMNGWIVENALDQATVSAMGLITVDHYPEAGYGSTLVPISQLASSMSADLDRFANKWGVPILIGEWGYNHNGEVSDDLQRQATDAIYSVFQSKPYIYGVSWWDHMGNQTRIINDSQGTPTTFRSAADVIRGYFQNNIPSDGSPIGGGTGTGGDTGGALIAGFEYGLDGFDHGTLIAGSNSAGAIRWTNPVNGSDGAKKNISSVLLSEQNYLEFDLNLNGKTLLSGDASAVYFEQGGWKYVSLSQYAQNGLNGWQHIRIPLSDFRLTANTAAYLGFRFWNYGSGNYDIDNIVLTGSTGSIPPPPASSGFTLGNFESGLDGFSMGTIAAGFQSGGALRLTNPAHGSTGTEKNLAGMKMSAYSRISFDINLGGAKLMPGDASALYFEQGGWKYVSLSKYVKNGLNGWQHLSIPLSDFQIDRNSGTAAIGFRFWNNPVGTYDLDNIVLE